MSTRIIVEGFKSIGKRVEVEVRPLTILAGANSSGKSSLMQSLLLLKQTLEASFDPGPLLLNGPNVKFTSVDQILHVETGCPPQNGFAVGLESGEEFKFETRLERNSPKSELEVLWTRVQIPSFLEQTFRAGSDLTEFSSPKYMFPKGSKIQMELLRDRFWLLPVAQIPLASGPGKQKLQMMAVPIDFSLIRDMIHVPGLRGNPARSYPLTSSGPRFTGTFENYTASIIWQWMSNDKGKDRLASLGQQLRQLGLTWKVIAKKIDGTSVELRVGRLAESVRGGAHDLVNIADVGFGVSQTLPVLVALLEARPGQLVYIEQPEIHLHPRAQVAMAGLIAEAAMRKVQIVIETHSSLLLLGIQTLVAEGSLSPELIKLHWFERDNKTGATHITSRDLDLAGRFGDWPEDFADISLEAESRFLDAVEAASAKE